MRRASLSGVRARLLALVMIATLPAVLLALYSGAEVRRDQELRARAEAQRLASVVADGQDRVLASTRQLLTTIAQVPAVRDERIGGCSSFLADVLAEDPI